MAFSFFMQRKQREERKNEARRERKPEIKPEIKKENGLVEQPDIIASDQKVVYGFIDASNLFWGGRASMGFGIDYKKLLNYLREAHGVSKVFYYGGVRIFDFEYSILDNKALDLAQLNEHLTVLKEKAEEKEKLLIERTLNKINFYQILENYGYVMKIKPAKVFYAEDDENEESPLLKANCDVDMTFDMMRYMQQYTGIVAMTGDGDFAAVLSYLKSHDRTVTILSRWDRTAKEIKTLAGGNFVDFEKLRDQIYLRH